MDYEEMVSVNKLMLIGPDSRDTDLITLQAIRHDQHLLGSVSQ